MSHFYLRLLGYYSVDSDQIVNILSGAFHEIGSGDLLIRSDSLYIANADEVKHLPEVWGCKVDRRVNRYSARGHRENCALAA